MTWKAEILTALKGRSRRYIFRAAFVAAPATIITSFEKGISTGLLLGVFVGVMVFVTDTVDTVRLARKRACKEATCASG